MRTVYVKYTHFLRSKTGRGCPKIERLGSREKRKEQPGEIDIIRIFTA
jgi:hypothetical protein